MLEDLAMMIRRPRNQLITVERFRKPLKDDQKAQRPNDEDHWGTARVTMIGSLSAPRVLGMEAQMTSQ